MEFERFQREKVEIGSRPRELEKLDRTTSERMGDLDNDNPNENVYHFLSPQRPVLSERSLSRRNFLVVHNHQNKWTNGT